MMTSEQDDCKKKIIDLRDIKKASEDLNIYLTENARWNQIQEKCKETRLRHRLEAASPEPKNFPLTDQEPEDNQLLLQELEPEILIKQVISRKMVCHRCNHHWYYSPKVKRSGSRYFTSCPNCRTSVRLNQFYIRGGNQI